MSTIKLTDGALDDLRDLEKSERVAILDTIARQLATEPLVQTRNRKPLRPNPISQWELRVDRFRVFYDVDVEDDLVTVKAVGWKEHNQLFFRGREFNL